MDYGTFEHAEIKKIHSQNESCGLVMNVSYVLC